MVVENDTRRFKASSITAGTIAQFNPRQHRPDHVKEVISPNAAIAPHLSAQPPV